MRQAADDRGPRLEGQSVFVVILPPAAIGGLLTVMLAYPMGLAVAVMAAPVGASVSAVLLVSYLTLRRSNGRTRPSRTIGSRVESQSQGNAPTNSKRV